MRNSIWMTVLVIGALAPALAQATTVTEPGRNGLPPTQVAPDRTTGASPGGAMDAPGGVGPGFTDPKNAPPGIVAPGAIGRNGIEPPDSNTR